MSLFQVDLTYCWGYYEMTLANNRQIVHNQIVLVVGFICLMTGNSPRQIG